MSTSYKYNAVSVLHVPNEKEDGIITVFEQYVLKHTLPSREKVHKILHLTRNRFSDILKIKIKKLLGR
ncbi:MAG: hypothetical protein E7638_08730 [Ruminococcaceae bacterium]|nr:hypothetical protein [Oscillospiraceae bacterium]